MKASYRDEPLMRATVRGKIDAFKEAIEIVQEAQNQDHENTFLLK